MNFTLSQKNIVDIAITKVLLRFVFHTSSPTLSMKTCGLELFVLGQKMKKRCISNKWQITKRGRTYESVSRTNNKVFYNSSSASLARTVNE